MRTHPVTTVADIGRIAGVSVTTVSRVLNNSGAVSHRKREAVLAAIRQTDFHNSRPRRGGRRHQPASAGTIVQIIEHRHSPVERLSLDGGELDVGPLVPAWEMGQPAPDGSFHRGIINGAIEELSRWGHRAAIRANANLLDPALIAEVRQPEPAGIVLVGEVSPDLDAFIRACRRPLVLADVLGSSAADVVTTDNTQGIADAFAHLYTLGHRRIGFIGARDRQSGRPDERHAAYRYNMVERGLSLRDDWVYHGMDHINPVATAVAAMLSAADRPTALLCQNDCCALGVVRAASRTGIAIPSQLSVIGFDDVDFAALVTPPLTSVRVNVREMGRRAVRELMIQMNGGAQPHACACRVRLIPELVIRESTAPPPTP